MNSTAYDNNNIFAKILRGALPCHKVDECAHTLSFRDINPQAPTHILVIPKGKYVTMSAFCEQASAEEQAAFISAIGRVVQLGNLGDKSYRVIINDGKNGHQEVPHLHAHILGGHPLGAMLVENR